MVTVIENVNIHTMDDNDTVIDSGYVKVEDGIIAELGSMSSTHDGADRVIDGEGAELYPGFVDAHTHLGMFEDSLTFEGDDGNEDSDPITPQLRAIDGANPGDGYFRESLLAGVTTVMISPGSTNPIAGQIAAIKTYGRRIDKMIVSSPAAIKFSLGENPKSPYNDKDQTPVTRMAVAALIRETLYKAKNYYDEKQEYLKDKKNNDEPEFDLRYEAFCPMFAGEIPAHFHVHRADDICTALRICREFGLRCVLVHATDAHTMTYEENGILKSDLEGECEGVLSGPFLTDRSKPELKNLSPSAPGILSSLGIPTAIITDHPETPLPFITICAAAAVRNGMDRNAAMKAITSTAAKLIGVYDRVGSVEVGKDADIVLFSGDPLDITNRPVAVMYGGEFIKSE